MSAWHLRQAARILRTGGVVAYPTEAVYGIGCAPRDEQAVRRILRLKERAVEKGLIVIGAAVEQLEEYMGPLGAAEETRVLSTWPGPSTWVVPASAGVPRWLTGGRSSIALRVTAHPVAAALCFAYGGALVSTSANVSGRPAARDRTGLLKSFGHRIDYIVPGPVGKRTRPSEIRDALSGAVLRAGGGCDSYDQHD